MSDQPDTTFPTASTVPFPFETPYTVQRELMAAILNSLKQCQDDDDFHKNENSQGAVRESVGNGTISSKKTEKKRKAPIIMLESPTGTGKSLSLACASMAWLRYCETADINSMMPSQNESIQVATPNATVKMTPSCTITKSRAEAITPSDSSANDINSKNTGKKYDWLDSWQPGQQDSDNNLQTSSLNTTSSKSSGKYNWLDSWQPNQQDLNNNDTQTSSQLQSTPQSENNRENNCLSSQTTPQVTQQEQIQQFALASRSALNSELNSIRARLDRLVNIANIASDANNSENKSNESTHNREKERTLRENLVRSGVASALAKERKLHRQQARIYSAQKQNLQNNKRRKNGSHIRARKEEDEFLVEEYHSDDDLKGNLSSDSDDDSIGHDVANQEAGNSKSRVGKSSSHSIPVSAKTLLNGSNLDGSGYNNTQIKSGRNNIDNNSRRNNADSSKDNPTVGGVGPGTGVRKIIYAARTHSQLSQFISELRRTHWGSTVKVVALGSRSLLCGNEDVMYSSKDAKVKKNRRSEAEITEMCLDMQKNKGKGDASSAKSSNAGEENGIVGIKRNAPSSSAGAKKDKTKQKSSCPYLASPEAISTLALHSLVRPSDIEDLASLGRASHACSYYASREGLAAAEVVVLPYNTLLSSQARKSVGISLKNALIVIDEAHNVPETLRNISSCQLSLKVAEAALSQLMAYTRRYSGRLAGRNLFYLGQIRRILMAMIKYLKRPSPAGRTNSIKSDTGAALSNENKNQTHDSSQSKEMMAAVELMFKLKLDNVNLFAILKYLERSRLSQKLLGFVNQNATTKGANSTLANEEKEEFMSKHISSLSIVETFLERLTSTDREGKIIVERPTADFAPEPTLERGSFFGFRFVRIHSTSQMDDILEEAHAVVLAGGTLRPFSHVAAELFGDDINVMRAASDAEVQLTRSYDNVPTVTQLGTSGHSSTDVSQPSSSVQLTARLTTFTCGHVIPPTNVVTACLSSGPATHQLDFRHASRSSNTIIDELGRAILNLCNVVPSGFVVFLPSYKYESQVFQRWRSSGALALIDEKKKIHREPKNSRDVEAALARYSKEASSSKSGALLFSVMGGKMSEGINFANDMARCVLVVGLPYPDITDPVLKEKMESLDKEYRDRGTGITGQAYYQNLCMRTVNQSVGRAIRHANDYAAIVLADFRYASDPRIWRGLPQWLRRGCAVPNQNDAVFGKVLKNIRSFFAGH